MQQESGLMACNYLMTTQVVFLKENKRIPNLSQQCKG